MQSVGNILKSSTLWLHSKNFFSLLSAKKYLRALSETALLYRPAKLRELTPEENLKDRVVQTFFDTSKISIKVSQAEERLKVVTTYSTPSHSFYQICLPFEHNQMLKRKMMQSENSNVRIGRILELMDYIAANVAYRYCTSDCDKDKDMDELKFILVTAAIDEIEFYHPISANHDCLLAGYVSHVGRTSMQVQIDALQILEGQQKLLCSAKFVMAARDKQTGKAYFVPRLNFDNEKETFRIANELGEQRQQTRKVQAARNLQISPPSYEQSVIIHTLMKETQLLLKRKAQREMQQQQSQKQEQIEPVVVPMSKTKQNNTMVMHLEDKNLSGKIFGGFIMRLAYQLGWLSAYKFLQMNPQVNHVDDVQFLKPVEIGSYLDLESKVAYVTDKFIHVVITCRNSKFTGEEDLTNVLRVTFEHSLGYQVRRVYPETLSDCYIYIESMRRVNKLMKA